MKLLGGVLFACMIAACGAADSDDSIADGGGGDAAHDAAASDGALDSTSDAKTADASSDAKSDAPDLSGSYACGDKTCGAGEYCIHPCGGGAIPMCTPKTNGGNCPAGMVTGYCMGDAGPENDGCVPGPPPPFCSPKPECPGGMTTTDTSKRDVGCMCA